MHRQARVARPRIGRSHPRPGEAGACIEGNVGIRRTAREGGGLMKVLRVLAINLLVLLALALAADFAGARWTDRPAQPGWPDDGIPGAPCSPPTGSRGTEWR